MVPSVAKAGHSFKGAMAYYLHDKRQDGQTAQPTTAERVAWTDVRNLATANPEAATKIMIATAQAADALKAAAGIKATGRKSNAHVYAYSLAWHPDEAAKLDKAEMLRAVDQSLKALGAEHLQAVIVCHTDQKHPHVHVIVNRVDPHTGKMLSTSNDRLKLSDWANQYERERGQIVTPKREEKRQQREQFAGKTTRQEYAQEQRAEATARLKADKSKAAMLKEFQEQQKADHKQQWKDLSAANKADRAAIYAATDERIKEAIARHKTETKPMWAEFFRQQRAEQRRVDRMGVIGQAMEAAALQKAQGLSEGRGTLSMVFANVLSSQSRLATFERQHELKRAAFSQELRGILGQELAALKGQRAEALARQRAAFDQDRAALIAKQDAERGKIREAWRQIYADRGKDPGARSRTYRERIERQKQWQAERTATKQQWAEQSAPPAYRRDVSLSPDQLRKGVERKQALQPQASTMPPARENPSVKGAFDKARELEAQRIEREKKLAAQKVQQFTAARPTAPHPAGVPTPAPSQPQAVPKVDKAKEWAKTPEGQRTVRIPAQPANEFKKAVRIPPASPAETKTPAQPATPAKAQEPPPRVDWSERRRAWSEAGKAARQDQNRTRDDGPDYEGPER